MYGLPHLLQHSKRDILIPFQKIDFSALQNFPYMSQNQSGHIDEMGLCSSDKPTNLILQHAENNFKLFCYSTDSDFSDLKFLS